MDVIVQQIGALVFGAVVGEGAPQPGILDQVAGLLKGAVPTSLLLHKPLSAALARRKALTEGAMEDAKKAVAEAEAKTAEYAEKLRLARSEAYKVREQRAKQWGAERDAALEEARKIAHQRSSQALAELDAEAAAARKTIEASSADLAAQAMQAVMPAAAGGAR